MNGWSLDLVLSNVIWLRAGIQTPHIMCTDHPPKGIAEAPRRACAGLATAYALVPCGRATPSITGLTHISMPLINDFALLNHSHHPPVPSRLPNPCLKHGSAGSAR